MAEEQVGDDIKVFAEGKILEHRGDAQSQRRAGIVQSDLMPAELDRARGRLMDAGQYFDQG